jgi:hypothetical protein
LRDLVNGLADERMAQVTPARPADKELDASPGAEVRRPRFAPELLVVLVGGLAGLVFLRAVSYAMQLDDVIALLGRSDHWVFMEAAHRLRGEGPLYREFQLAGPYSVRQYTADTMGDLYPPTTYVLIVAMSFLPDVLWWAVPLSILAAIVWYWRPSLAGWAGILACFAPPWAWDGILSGGLFMWVAAFVALGTRWPIFFAGVLLKPNLFPFALFGIRSRWWWVAVLAGSFVGLMMLPLWVDYAKVLTNLKDGGLLYSIHNVPLVLVPLVARATRKRLRQPASTRSGPEPAGSIGR